MNTNIRNSNTHYLYLLINSKGFNSVCAFPSTFLATMDLRDMEYQIGKLAPHLIESKKIAFGTKKVPIHIIKAWEKTGAVIIVDDVAPFDYFMGLKSEHRFGLELEEL